MHVQRATPVEASLTRLESPPPMIPTGPPPSDWHRYVTAVLRHRWLVLAVTVLGTLAGVAATRLLDPRYAARAVLWIETPEPRSERDLMFSNEVMETGGWAELVRSHAVLDSVVRQQRLFIGATPADQPLFDAFDLRDRGRPGRYRLRVSEDGGRYVLTDVVADQVLEEGAVGDSIGRELGFGWAPALPAGRDLEFQVISPYDAAQRLAAAIDVTLDPGSSFLRIELKGTNAASAAATVNAIADGAARVAADLKRRKFEELADILGGQLDHAESELRDAESRLREFRVRTGGRVQTHAAAMAGIGSTENPLLARSLDLSVSYDELERDRRTIQQLLESPERGRSWIEALAVVGAVQQSPPLMRALEEATEKQAEIRALKYRYTDQSAPVIETQADLDQLEQRSIPALASRLVSDLGSRASRLRARVDSSSRVIRQIPVIAIDEARLVRDVANTEELHNTVRQRYEAARLSLVSSLPDVRVLDAAAAPGRPLADYGPLVIGFAFVLSLLLAIVIANLYDHVDPKVRYPEQVTDRMRLNILGAVPHVSWRQTQAGDPAAGVIESLRGLRVRVANALNGGRPIVFTVTSPGIGEGKSFVSLNLALSFAYAGKKTLLIDGDVRRGVQHRVLGLHRRPGLTDVLAGKVPVADAIRAAPFDHLSFLGCGTHTKRAPELLLSEGLRKLIEELRHTYDAIVVDSPPLGAGADPLVLGAATGNLLLVLRSGTTDLALALSKLDEIDTLPVRTIGAVLNDVRGGDAFRYYTYESASYGEPEDDIVAADSPEPYQILGGRS